MQHWDDFKYLLALEETGSLTRAAKALRTNPTTVSRHIKRLSETYKKTLVTRRANGEWSLTKEGMMFAATAKRCASAISALSNNATEDRPEITVTTTDFVGDYILSPQIHNMMEAPDSISLTIDMRDRNLSLAFGEADLAVRLGRPKSGKLIASKLADLEMNIFSPQGRMTKRWVGLPAQYDWVPEMQLGLDFFGCEPTIRVGSFSSIREIALQQDLACIGPNLMMEDWAGLKRMDTFGPSAIREVWSVFHESRRHDDALYRARKWVKSCFSKIEMKTAA